jgi:hypothetical protein
VAAVYATLDPVQLLSEILTVQQQLVEIADRPAIGELAAPTGPTQEQFLSGLRTAWQEGEARPTNRPKEKAKLAGGATLRLDCHVARPPLTNSIGRRDRLIDIFRGCMNLDQVHDILHCVILS